MKADFDAERAAHRAAMQRSEAYLQGYEDAARSMSPRRLDVQYMLGYTHEKNRAMKLSPSLADAVAAVGEARADLHRERVRLLEMERDALLCALTNVMALELPDCGAVRDAYKLLGYLEETKETGQ